MKISCRFFMMGALIFSGLFCQAQRVMYSEPENDDSRQMSFEVIGKMNNQYLVYKNIRFRNQIVIYDDQMKVTDKVNLDFMPDSYKIINTDFVCYNDYALMFYQYQRRSIVYCMGARIDPNGHIVGEPVELDTALLRLTNENKIFSVVTSDDKQKIMLFKINNRNREKYLLTTLLFNNKMELQKKSYNPVAMDEKNSVLTDFYLTNEGDFIFGKCNQQNRDYINQMKLMIKPAAADNLQETGIELGNRLLDEVKLKVDNVNKHLIVAAFFYKQKRSNIEGVYINLWNLASNTRIVEGDILFNEDLRQAAKGDASVKMAFNDFYINRIIPKKDGGFLLTTENYYTQSRGGNYYNRRDWMWGSPYYSNSSFYDYYMWNSYGTPWSWYYFNNPNRNSITRHISENIAVFSFDANAKAQWTNVINKSQYDDNTPDFISHQLFLTGGEIHFLFNSLEKRGQMLLNDQGLTADGQLKRYPTWRGLSKDYDLMMQLGKQVSARQMIVPCMYRNYLCFAKLEL